MTESFFTSVELSEEEELEEIITGLQNSEIFSGFSEDFIRQLIDFSDINEFPQGHDILTEGQLNTTAFFLLRGEVGLYQDNQHIFQLNSIGDLLDEVSIITHQPCATTIKVETEIAKILSIESRLMEKFGHVFEQIIRQMLIRKQDIAIQRAKQFSVATEYLANSENDLIIFELTADQSLDRIMFIDPFGKVLYVNHAYLKMTGYQAHEVIGKHYHKLRQSKYPDELYENINEIIVEGQQFRGVSEYRTPKMGIVYETLTVTPVMHGDSLHHYVAIAQNVTGKEKKKRQEKEDLQYGIEFQRQIFGDVPDISYLSYSELVIPHSGVSGDFRRAYIDEKNNFRFFYGDATGHGIKAALITAVIYNALKELSPKNNCRYIMESLNNRLEGCLPNDCFVTGMSLKIQPNGEMEFSSAGHTLGFLIRPDQGQIEFLGKKSGFPLGMLSNEDLPLPFVLETNQLFPGDKLFLYTDGITETSNDNEELYGNERLVAFLRENRDEPVNVLLMNLNKELYDFSQGHEQLDDVSAYVIEYKGEE